MGTAFPGTLAVIAQEEQPASFQRKASGKHQHGQRTRPGRQAHLKPATRMGVRGQGLLLLGDGAHPLLPLPLAEGSSSSNSERGRTSARAVGGPAEGGCLPAGEAESRDVTRGLGPCPVSTLPLLVCQPQPQSPQGHRTAADAPGLTSRCHNARHRREHLCCDDSLIGSKNLGPPFTGFTCTERPRPFSLNKPA